MRLDVGFHTFFRAEGVVADGAFVHFFAVVGYLKQVKQFYLASKHFHTKYEDIQLYEQHVNNK